MCAFRLAPISSALGPSSCFSPSAQGVAASLMRSSPVGRISHSADSPEEMNSNMTVIWCGGLRCRGSGGRARRAIAPGGTCGCRVAMWIFVGDVWRGHRAPTVVSISCAGQQPRWRADEVRGDKERSRHPRASTIPLFRGFATVSGQPRRK